MRKQYLRTLMDEMYRFNTLNGVTVRLFDRDKGEGIDTPYIGGLRDYVLDEYKDYFVYEVEMFTDDTGETYCDIDIGWDEPEEVESPYKKYKEVLR